MRVDGDEVVATHVGATGAVEVARHLRSTPGTPRIDDAHYPPRPAGPLNRQPTATNAAEAEFLALGDGARMWLVEAASAGTARVKVKMADAVTLARLHGVERVDWALDHAATYARFADGDLASILAPPTPPENRSADDTHSLQAGTRAWDGFEHHHDRRRRLDHGRRGRRAVEGSASAAHVATPPTCWQPPRRNAGNPPKPCGRCSPRSSPADKHPRSTPAGQPPGFPPARPSTPGTRTCRSIPAPTQRSLATLEWIDRHENLVVCGPSGTGKTHLLEALGHAAIGHGCHVQWFSLEALEHSCTATAPTAPPAERSAS